MINSKAIHVQLVLKRLGYDLGSTGEHHDGVDGVFGDLTYDAILAELSKTAPPAAVAASDVMSMAWGRKVSAQFREGVWWICDQFGWDRRIGGDNLMSCIAWESGETFSPSVVNKAGSGATGLIQFMPKTAAQLGTSTRALAAMTAERQLGFVYLYFKQFSKMRGPNVTLADMYMAILMPGYIGASEDTPIFSGGIAYRQNSGLDANRDGKVTKLEAASKVYAKLERGRLPEFRWAA